MLDKQMKSNKIKKSAESQMPELMVTFIENHKVPLECGKYNISLKHVVSDKSKTRVNETFQSEYGFAIQGERFSINSADIRLMFPPKNSQGEFLNNLPHIIFNKHTLPWIRTSAADKESGETLSTWLALLLFTQDDPLPDTQDKTIKDLFAKNLDSNILSYPNVKPLEYGEKEGDACKIVDIPIKLFNAVAPEKNELNYLAHARRIKIEEDDVCLNSRQDVSVVVGNRLPQKGANSTVHLVSLEGMADYLPDENGNGSSQITGEIEFVRLVSLASWNFFTNDITESFKGIVESLNADSAALSVPLPDDGGDIDPFVINSFSMGYTAMDHHTRQGDSTISWYKGPFLPYAVAQSIDFPKDSADGLLNYDPAVGMFDVSYGAAWTLGRQLALQNKQFSVMLYNVRKRRKQEILSSRMKEAIMDRLNSNVTCELKTGALYESPLKLAVNFLAEKLPSLTNASQSQLDGAGGVNDKKERLKSLWRAPKGDFKCYAAGLNNSGSLVADQDDIDPPLPLIDFLIKIKLLNGVPFNYLVPEESMLPVESIRIFHVDGDWVNSLLDGALSVGRFDNSDKAYDQVLKGAAQDGNQRPITGLLLRSSVVEGWPTLRVKAYVNRDDVKSRKKVPILRMDIISSNILLVLFEGVVGYFEIHEPPEGIHFGVTMPDNPDAPDAVFTKELKYLTTTASYDAGEKIPDVSISVPFRPGSKNVLKISQFADDIKNKIPGTEIMTSAEFALEMVEGMQSVSFEIEKE